MKNKTKCIIVQFLNENGRLCMKKIWQDETKNDMEFLHYAEVLKADPKYSYVNLYEVKEVYEPIEIQKISGHPRPMAQMTLNEVNKKIIFEGGK